MDNYIKGISQSKYKLLVHLLTSHASHDCRLNCKMTASTFKLSECKNHQKYVDFFNLTKFSQNIWSELKHDVRNEKD